MDWTQQVAITCRPFIPCVCHVRALKGFDRCSARRIPNRQPDPPCRRRRGSKEAVCGFAPLCDSVAGCVTVASLVVSPLPRHGTDESERRGREASGRRRPALVRWAEGVQLELLWLHMHATSSVRTFRAPVSSGPKGSAATCGRAPVPRPMVQILPCNRTFPQVPPHPMLAAISSPIGSASSLPPRALCTALPRR